MANFLDLTGGKFGRLTVIELSRDVKKGNRYRKYWNCRCECGKFKEIRTDSLTSGNVKSCGCIKKEQDSKNLTPGHRKYEILDKRLRGIWNGMKSRCFNDDNHRFSRYGAKGISICEEWLDFNVFAKWSLENGYNENLTIDRIDNNGSYTPLNCRWADNKTQCRNRSTNILIEFNGKLITLIELSEITGLSYGCLSTRYAMGKRGDKLIEHVRDCEEYRAKLDKKTVIEIREKYCNGYTIKELSEIYPVSYGSIFNIVHRKTWKNI